MHGSKRGPNRDPNALRRARPGDSGASLTVLPAECPLPVPEPPPGCQWPKRGAERKLWDDIWSGPVGCYLDETFSASVALYVVYAVRVLRGDVLKTYEAQMLRGLANDLGLTPAGLRNLGFTTTMPEVGE